MIGDTIKELRLAKGLNQVELAEKLGITKQSVSNYEKDNIAPSIDMVVKLANFFEVSTDFILENESSKTINIDGLTEHQVGIIKSLIDEFRNNN